jgi:hypothetical protein
MSLLPPLRGSAKQVKWAETIRDNTFQDRDSYGMDVLVVAEKVDDATWWIASNDRTKQQMVSTPKPPAPHQLVGGPPPPAKQRDLPIRAGDEPEPTEPCPPARLATHTGEYTGKPQRDSVTEPHEAERFAESVCHHPALAEVAVLGLMAKQYLRSTQKEVGQFLLDRARLKLRGLRERLIAAVDKDLNGLERILK